MMRTAHEMTKVARTSRISRRTRAAAVALGSTLVAATLAVGASPAAAEDPPKPVLIAVTAYPPVVQLSTPAEFLVTGGLTLNAPTSGRFTVTLHRPPADGAEACTGSPHSYSQIPVTAVAATTPAVPNMVPVNKTLDVPATIRISNPEGRYQYQATFAPDGGGAVVKSTCFEVNVAHRKDVDPPKPNDPKPTPTAIQAQVTKHFRLMLDRDPTQVELSTWVGKLQAGTSTVGDLVADLRGSNDHVSIIDPVTRLYFAYFLRSPDADGLDYWIGQRRGGRSLVSTSDFFSRSPEFDRRYGSLGNAAFVDLIYRNILERGADDKGKSFWTGQLDQGVRTRGDVMVGFSESPEYREAIANEVHVSVLYVLLIGRAPTAVEFDSVVDLLDIEDTAVPFTVADLADALIERRTTIR